MNSAVSFLNPETGDLHLATVFAQLCFEYRVFLYVTEFNF